MRIRSLLATVAATALLATPALAGPCSDQIAALGKAVSGSDAMGPASTGTLSGSNPGQAPQPSPQVNGTSAQSGDTEPTKTGQSGRPPLTGDAGSRELNAASAQVATSDQDVRRQQAGQPTMANNPNAKPADDTMARAKGELERARELDAKNDASCHDAVRATQQLVDARKG